MPTYEFRCPQGHDFEKFYRSIGGAPTEVFCPSCGKVAIRQLSAGGGLLFRGTGFYITDYGKDGKKQATVAPAPDKPEGTSAGDSSTSRPESSAGADKSSSAAGESGAGPAKAAPEPKPATAKKPKAGE